jgi:4'-phosphopantetheinyl transferase
MCVRVRSARRRDILSHMFARVPALAPAEVRVYYADASTLIAASGGVERALACLHPAEPERFARYRKEDDRLNFLCGRLMARSLVGSLLGVPPTSWRWREGPHGRPEIAEPDTTLRFNIAHSGGLVACALADGRDVGVDVEDVTRHQVDIKVVHRYFSPVEAADVVAQGEDWMDRFFLYWTLKEAYLKARGLGIAVPLSEITFRLAADRASVSFAGSLAGLDTRWTLRLMRPTTRHQMAVAASEADGATPSLTIEPLRGPLPL